MFRLNLQFDFKTWMQPTEKKSHVSYLHDIFPFYHHVSTNIYTYIYIYIHYYIFVYICIYICVCVWILCVYIYILYIKFMRTHIYMCMIYICVYIYILIYVVFSVSPPLSHGQAPALATDGVREQLRRGGDGWRTAAHQAEDAPRCGRG